MAKRAAGIHKDSGFTLLELLIVVAVLSIMSAAALPMANAIQAFVLDKAVSQVKHVLQFAREHAKVTDDLVIVHFDNAAGAIRVNRIDFSMGSAVEFPVTHPLTKQDYVVDLNSQPLIGTSTQVQAEFTFSDGSKAPNVTFDESGIAGRAIGEDSFLPIKEPGLWRGFWRIGEGYDVGDWIEHEKILYDSLSSHIAGSSFVSDLDSGKWQVRTLPGQVRISAGHHQQSIHVEPAWGFTRVAPK